MRQIEKPSERVSEQEQKTLARDTRSPLVRGIKINGSERASACRAHPAGLYGVEIARARIPNSANFHSGFYLPFLRARSLSAARARMHEAAAGYLQP